jgi:site-specific recombinase XerD
MTFSEAVSEYLTHVEVYASPGTYAFYKQHLKYPLSVLGNLDVADIDSRAITGYILSQRERNPSIGNATLNKHILSIRCACQYVTGISIKRTKLREQGKLIKPVSDTTAGLIFKYYETRLDNKYDYRNYMFFRLLNDTGLRMNEMINIRLENIDFEQNRIEAHVTKTKQDRVVFFTHDTAIHLKKFIALHVFNDHLFYDFKTGNRMTTSAVESFISRLSKKLDIKESITPHKWRHRMATRFIRKSGNIEGLRQILGHKTYQMTERYLHLSTDDLKTMYDNALG